MKHIGIIGIGLLGSAVASRLLKRKLGFTWDYMARSI